MAASGSSGANNPALPTKPGPSHKPANQTLGETASPNPAPSRMTKTGPNTVMVDALPSSNDINGQSNLPPNNKDAGGRT